MRTMETLTQTTNKRVILVDINFFMFSSIFVYAKTRQVPPTYTALSMLIGNLKNVGITPDDLVILAVDSKKGSWRKEIDPAYKGNRKADREKHDIDWKKHFAEFNELYERLDAGTPFHVVEAEKLEADDIIAFSCRYFKDRECIIISVDADYEQLVAFPNVKLFSPKSKRYKTVKNPYAILASKIRKEQADNLITEIHTELDYINREKIVNLLRLPEEIDKKVEEVIYFLPEKDFDYDVIPFKSIQEKFKTIYGDTKHIVSEKTLSRAEKRKLREEKRIQKLKEKYEKKIKKIEQKNKLF